MSIGSQSFLVPKRIPAIITFTILVLVAIIYLSKNQVNISIPFVAYSSVSLSDILLFLLLVVDSLAIYIEFRERKLRRKYRHSLDLIKEVFDVGLSEKGHVNYQGDEIVPFYVNWAESNPMFPYVVKHLNDRKYKKIWQMYENGKQYAKSIIDEIVREYKQYREAMEQKLTEAKIPIPTSERFIDHQTKHYDQKFVKHLIFVDTKNILRYGTKYNELKVNVSASPNFSSLNWGASTFAIGEESSIKSLQNIIERLENDEIITNILRDIGSLETQLKDNKELEQFDRGREEIVRQVKYGQKPLWGRCNLCP